MRVMPARNKSFSCPTYDEISNEASKKKGDSREDNHKQKVTFITGLMRVGGSVLSVVHTLNKMQIFNLADNVT